MKNIFSNLKNSFFIGMALGLCLIPRAFAVPLDGILAIVNNDVITYQDLNSYLKARAVQLEAEGMPKAEIQKMLSDLENNGIKRLIQDKIVTAEANKKQITIRKEMVDHRLEIIKQKYPSEEMFLAMLGQDGMTVSDLRKRIEDQLKAQQLVEAEVKSKVHVNPQDITDYYNANISQFQIPERISLDSIFVAKGNDLAKAKEKIQKAQELIKSGQDFHAVAKDYSEAPAFGVVSRGKLLPEIEDAVWKMSVNQTSDILEVDNGFYIFKILAINPAQTAKLEEVKDMIQQALFQEKFVEALTSWLDQLEKKAFIDIKDEAL